MLKASVIGTRDLGDGRRTKVVPNGLTPLFVRINVIMRCVLQFIRVLNHRSCCSLCDTLDLYFLGTPRVGITVGPVQAVTKQSLWASPHLSGGSQRDSRQSRIFIDYFFLVTIRVGPV